MRIGIISDVHSNMPALDVVLDFLRKKNVDMIINAGDTVGYNAFPNEVIDSVSKNCAVSVAGNHDRAVVTGDVSWFNYDAANAVKWTVKKLNEDSWKFLRNLKNRERIVEDGKCIVIIHGSPKDYDEYVYEGSANEDMLKDTGADILVLGHTHVPFVARFDIGIVLNPGSVGQPRDKNFKASCAILDTVGPSVDIHRLEYPVEKTMDANVANNLPMMLAERLMLGI